MLDGFVNIFKMIFKIFYPIIIFVIIFFLIYTIIIACWLFYFKCKGYVLPKTTRVVKKDMSFFRKVFWEVPRRYVLDMYEQEDFFFKPCGIHMFCGEQGSGKTMAMVESILRCQKYYPLSKTITNFGLVTENDSLEYWQMLIDYTNGKKGVIVGLDEIQNWFMSGKNQLPEGMLEVVTQNRKNRRVIYCTSQVFTRVNKAIREQVSLVYEPHTFLGCFTVVLVYKPRFDSEGNVVERKWRDIYSFVHTDELRNAYDTYKAIHMLSEEGFKEKDSQTFVNNWIVMEKNKKRR